MSRLGRWVADGTLPAMLFVGCGVVGALIAASFGLSMLFHRSPVGEPCDPIRDTVKTVDRVHVVCALDYDSSDYRWRR